MTSVLVTGATGTQGGAVARALVDGGHTVSALVRDPEAPRAQALTRLGIHLQTGDLTDPESLTTPFAEIDALYAVTTPFGDGAAAEIAQGAAIISAAQSARVPWTILASVAAANRADVPHFASKAKIEEGLRASSLRWTIVAPSYFYENVGVDDGVLSLPLPADKPLHQIALADLGAVVTAILTRGEEHIGKRVELAGDAPTPTDMAAALGARYERQAIDAIAARSPDLAAMYTFLSGPGYGIDVAAVRATYPEVPWRSFSEWARRRRR